MAAKYPPRTSLTKPHVILCEGRADEAFLRVLAQARGLPELSIRNTSDADSSGRGGIDKFEKLLLGIRAYEGFPNVTKILIVADNDHEPQVNLGKVRTQLQNAGYVAPTEPGQTVAGSPSVTILMVPWTNVAGHLESLCLPSAMSVAGNIPGCVDHFVGCIEATEWEAPSLAKLKLRSILAAGHRPDPFIGLGNVWRENAELIPLNHDSFNQIADALATFLA